MPKVLILFLMLFLLYAILFSLVACSSSKPTEYLYTTHGIYFNIDGTNLLITPSGIPYVFTTNEKISYVDGDVIQFNFEYSMETYPEQIVAINIKVFDKDIKLDNIAKVMKTLKTEYEYNFDEEIYSSLVKEDDDFVDDEQTDEDALDIEIEDNNADVNENVSEIDDLEVDLDVNEKDVVKSDKEELQKDDINEDNQDIGEIKSEDVVIE